MSSIDLNTKYGLLKQISFGLLLILAICISGKAAGQCNTLRPQISLDFNTDQDCAPVAVTNFTITYFFNVAQNPADIEIQFEWNDPLNSFSFANIGNGDLIPTVGNTVFTATGSFVYNDNNGQCAVMPTASIFINGIECPTSEETQTAFFWSTDDMANAMLAIDPNPYDVCFNNPITNAVFTDNSEFNCNINVEPDNPNELARHVQFVYGTNHNPAATILDLTLLDGGVVGLTDGTGNLVAPQTRGTGVVTVTGAYFGPVDAVPFPANAPNAVSFPMNAPASPLNVIGNRFEVSMFNWNACNPWNGDPVNPNYEDAIFETTEIVIIDAPDADFVTRENSFTGPLAKDFCIGDVVYFDNQSVGNVDEYEWTFFDGELLTDPVLGTSNLAQPTFQYATGGRKLIQLLVRDLDAQSSCESIFLDTVSISPTAIASIRMEDAIGNVLTAPTFCQNFVNSQTFEVRFFDNTNPADINVNTSFRWEFYDENQALIESYPGGAGNFSNTQLGPFDRQFVNAGIYNAILIIQDGITACPTIDTAQVAVLSNPIADFDFDPTTCEGEETNFTDLSNIPTVINNDSIVLWEWDFSFDGVVFNVERSFSSAPGTFQEFLGNPGGPSLSGNYDIGLRVTTANGCFHVETKNVVVENVPIADFIPNSIAADCPPLAVDFENISLGLQPSGVTVDRYEWYVDLDDGNGFVIDSIQNPTDQFFSRVFLNEKPVGIDHIYQVFLRSVATNGCAAESDTVEVRVLSAPESGFISDYSIGNPNCSPVTVNFAADPFTQSLNPDSIVWTISSFGNQVYTETQASGNPDLGELSYAFTNDSTVVFQFNIEMAPFRSDLCIAPFEEAINIFPVPPSGFSIIDTVESCTQVTFTLHADDPNLSDYQWNFSTLPINAFGNNAEISVTFNRPLESQPDDNLLIELRTVNSFNCPSSISSLTQTIENQEPILNLQLDLLSVSGNCPPYIATFENTTVVPAELSLTEFRFLVREGAGPFEEQAIASGDINGVFTYEFPGSGQFLTILEATTPLNCQSTSSPPDTIEVFDASLARFDIFQTEGCAPLNTGFLENSINSISTNWTIQDLSTNTILLNNVDTSFSSFEFPNTTNTTKTYEITLQTVSVNGCISDSARLVTVFPEAESLFIPASNNSCEPYIIDFTNVSNNPVGTQYVWDWGDGTFTSSNSDSIVHQFINESFSATLVYPVTLTTTTPDGCIASYTETITLFPRVDAQISSDIDSGCAPFNVLFSNSSRGSVQNEWIIRELTDPASAPKIFSSGFAPSFTFENETDETKEYQIIYTAANSGGCIDRDTLSIVAYPNIIASFEATPLQQVLPDRTVFVENTTNFAGSWQYSWTFGDENGTDEAFPASHEYETFGTYTIRMRAFSEHCSSLDSQTVIIFPIVPMVDFVGAPLEGCAPLEVQFENLTRFADPDTYEWDFGDGQGRSTAENPSYIYNRPGSYTVSLKASNELGLFDSLVRQNYVVVEAQPSARFDVEPDLLFLPDDVLFTSNGSFGATSYLWDFGDRTTSTDFQPEHQYLEEGTYLISLTAFTDFGCADTAFLNRPVMVSSTGRVSVPNAFSPSLTGPNGGVVNDLDQNDVFLPITEGVVGFNMLIFNKWGELLFETNNKEIGWDGYVDGVLSPPDVYVYRLKLTFSDSQEVERLGDLTLIR
ncbi:MAG: PKD domain-containing protein [Bacteroidota bacterium]